MLANAEAKAAVEAEVKAAEQAAAEAAKREMEARCHLFTSQASIDKVARLSVEAEIARIQDAMHPYKVLNLHPPTGKRYWYSSVEVDSAFRKIALMLHPDKTNSPGAAMALAKAASAKAQMTPR